MSWGTEEAWLFLSIGDAGGGKPATLDLVIGAADSNNHAIPTHAEVEKAISQLLGAGLIATDEDKFSLTSAGQEIFQRENAVRGRGHITRFLELADKWGTTPPSHADPIQWRLQPGQLEAAYEAYHRRFQEWFQKYRRNRESK